LGPGPVATWDTIAQLCGGPFPVVLLPPATIDPAVEKRATQITVERAPDTRKPPSSGERDGLAIEQQSAVQAMISDRTFVDIGAPPPTLGAAGSNARSIVSRMSDVLPAAV